MNTNNSVGLYGKLPAHGDFIYRNLSNSFITAWDTWLQGCVACSQEQLAESWLDIYLTSPIWRFAFSDGVIDERVWVGIVLPSVDRVGRYFPFSIAMPVAASANPMELIAQTQWFEAMETLALQALDGQLQIEELLEQINAQPFDQTHAYICKPSPENKLGTVVKMDFAEQSPSSTHAPLLNSLLKDNLASYSVWSTQGSQYVEPCLFYSRSFPPMQGVAAMLDGRWEQWGWNQPCQLKLMPQ
ncbi:MAG TPA: type VI secretion system-associated protein TagF [Cellvibrio sp.]|nr:type VI secretion system-associated protein TagF [Cellvibrio sp.]